MPIIIERVDHMSSPELSNCRICGRLFLKDHTYYCLDCFKEIEEEFKEVNEFLKSEHNHHATLEDVSEATGVGLKRIADFIRDGRIFAADFPNLGYPCAQCGKVIKRQVLCDDCFIQFSSEINKTLKHDKFMNEAVKRPTQTERNAQYWQLKKDK